MGDPQQLQIEINQGDSTSALLYAADTKKCLLTTIILGHGAGAGQQTPIMQLFAKGLAARGFDVLTFNFVYMEQRKKVPDRNDKLELCYRAVIDTAAKHKKLKKNRIVIGGKSMGGRIASQVAAYLANNPAADDDIEGISGSWLKPAINGLVFLGYPLHPPGRPDKLRDAHLKDIKAPMLFIQGSRDAFGTADEIRALIKRFKLPASLYAIEGGDHSLKVPKTLGTPQVAIYEGAMNHIAEWFNKLTS
jgi:hypothetical protein